MQALIFTDLDGTLMDHETYSIEPARQVLDQIAASDTPLIFNSSKTRAEIISLQQQLNLHCPFICENGAALYNYKEPDYSGPTTYGPAIESWLGKVHDMRAERGYRFDGFSDWSIAEVSKHTGLSQSESALAKKREFSEPIQWHDSQEALEEFQQELTALQLQLLEGGRFYSVQGIYDKSTAMHWLMSREANQNKIIVALGDGPNDHAMLNAADVAVIIKSAKSSRIQLDSPSRVIRSSEPGPEGWQAAMSKILAQLNSAELSNQENTHG